MADPTPLPEGEMLEMRNRLPLASDMAAEATRLGARYLMGALNKSIRETTAQRQRQCTLEAPFNQRIVDALESKGYTVTHDNTAYTITW